MPYFCLMIITDTHTHLYSEQFDGDRSEMIERAMTNGVRRFFIPAIDSSYTAAMLDLKKNYPNNIYLMTGLHPTHVKEETLKKELEHVVTLLDSERFYAIGETGIDLYWDTTTLDLQIEAFEYQIKLAKQHNLPIVIHCRDAFDEIFKVLHTHYDEQLYGIFHCFTGTLEQAKEAISLNMKLGIGGVVTFKNGKIDQFLHEIDIKQIVLETDSPYLAPVPYRGKRNESNYIMNVLEKVSEIYGIPESEVAAITTENSKQIFGI